MRHQSRGDPSSDSALPLLAKLEFKGVLKKLHFSYFGPESVAMSPTVVDLEGEKKKKKI